MKRIKYNLKKIESGEAIYIGRGFRYHNIPRSKWANPFSVKKYGREKALMLFKEYLFSVEGRHLLNDLPDIEESIICCHCKEDEACHGDILIDLYNKMRKKCINNTSEVPGHPCPQNFPALEISKENFWVIRAL